MKVPRPVLGLLLYPAIAISLNLSLNKVYAAELKNWLAHRDTWMTEARDYLQVNPLPSLSWTSDSRQSIALAKNDNLSFLNHPVEELQVHFDNQRPARISLAMYTIGGQDLISQAEFHWRLTAIQQSLNSFLKIQPGNRENTRRGRIQVYQQQWELRNLTWTLRWSETPGARSDMEYRPEFIILDLRLRYQDGEPLAERSDPNHISLIENLVQNEQGDVYVSGIPMVDQGDRGYCAVASLERILQYYRIEIDQHELAQLARTTAHGGTKTELFFEALKQIGPSLGIYVRSHEEMDTRQLQQTIRQYNRLVRREALPQVRLEGTVSVAAIYQSMNYSFLKQARTQRSSQVRSFKHTVKRYVDRGIPLLWSCMLGIGEPGDNTSTATGHMRLIVGYNEITKTIIFSDSWGAGHEKKHIPLDHAWTITSGLYTVELRTYQ